MEASLKGTTGSPPALVRLIVRRVRRGDESPLNIPGVRPRGDNGEAKPGAITQQFEGSTPTDREILRKLGFKIERGIQQAGLLRAQKAATPQTSPSIGPEGTTSQIDLVPQPAIGTLQSVSQPNPCTELKPLVVPPADQAGIGATSQSKPFEERWPIIFTQIKNEFLGCPESERARLAETLQATAQVFAGWAQSLKAKYVSKATQQPNEPRWPVQA